ncbi:MAG: HTH domain-containing protein [Lachnospiraceae bacterium]|nr:HTH domain-containing protein [Lachnospiraceae bacterium]
MYKNKQINITEFAGMLRVSRTTIYKYIKLAK